MSAIQVYNFHKLPMYILLYLVLVHLLPIFHPLHSWLIGVRMFIFLAGVDFSLTTIDFLVLEPLAFLLQPMHLKVQPMEKTFIFLYYEEMPLHNFLVVSLVKIIPVTPVATT